MWETRQTGFPHSAPAGGIPGHRSPEITATINARNIKASTGLEARQFLEFPRPAGKVS